MSSRTPFAPFWHQPPAYMFGVTAPYELRIRLVDGSSSLSKMGVTLYPILLMSKSTANSSVCGVSMDTWAKDSPSSRVALTLSVLSLKIRGFARYLRITFLVFS